ncbi:MAG: hypothetical protein V1653_01590 [bacterium]
MKKFFWVLALFLFLIPKPASWAFDPKDFGMSDITEVDETERNKDSFIGLAGGYHQSSFDSYNNDINTLNNDPILSSYGYKMDKLQGNALDGKFSLGYRMGQHALVFGVGYFDQVKADSKWTAFGGAMGDTSVSAFFVDLTYRYYLKAPDKGTVSYEVGTLVPYIGGGGGWYFGSWNFYDPYLSWTDLETGERNNRVNGKGNNFGVHAVGGMEFFISPKVSLNFQVDYTYAIIREVSAKLTKSGDTVTEQIVYFGNEQLQLDLSGPSVLIGVNYHL